MRQQNGGLNSGQKSANIVTDAFNNELTVNYDYNFSYWFEQVS